MSAKRQVRPIRSENFLQRHTVFTLDQFAAALPLHSGRSTARERVRYLAARGRIQVLGRGVYATVPHDVRPGEYQPDAVLVALAMRPDIVFSHHSALELHGAAHSIWSEVSGWTRGRRGTMQLGGVRLRFLSPPTFQRPGSAVDRAVVTAHRDGTPLRITSRERTLVECLRQQHLAGGLEEIFESAAGFASLDLAALERLLVAFDQRLLWAATGWFLERHERTFHPTAGLLRRFESHRPRSPQYLPRLQRGGALISRWNLVVPRGLARGKEPDDP
ncbi:MAG: hypothetical protein IT348_19065 [Candidatus Eisenbacteria bacterium]|nr:hypothetical protein [Candidatus Eisenbacteria bacterium]